MRRAILLLSILPAVTGLTAAAATITLNSAGLANVNNLQQLALAMINYSDATGRLPAQYLGGGPPLLSWRVALLPYLNQQALYNQFDLAKSWDDPVNLPLLQQMPQVFRSPVDPSNATTTRYLVGSGLNTVFDGAAGIRPTDIIDGTSNTILFGEAAAGVPWTKPDDIAIGLAPVLGGGGFGSFTPGAVAFAFADGSVRFLPYNIDSQALRSLFLRNDRAGDISVALDYTAAPEPATVSTTCVGALVFLACFAFAARRDGRSRPAR